MFTMKCSKSRVAYKWMIDYWIRREGGQRKKSMEAQTCHQSQYLKWMDIGDSLEIYRVRIELFDPGGIPTHFMLHID